MGFNSSLRWIALVAAPIVMLTSEIAVAQQAQKEQAQEIETCYMKTQSGQVIKLDKLCRSKIKPSAGGSNRMKPGDIEKTPNGWAVMPGGSKPVQLPDGSVVYPDGRLAPPGMDGFSIGFIMKNGEPAGTQYYRPDGFPMQPGEFHKLASGEVIEQRGFK
jgi:hypothetical protein